MLHTEQVHASAVGTKTVNSILEMIPRAIFIIHSATCNLLFNLQFHINKILISVTKCDIHE